MSASRDNKSECSDASGYLTGYRGFVQELEQRSQGAYDRTVLSLSGGALVLTLGLVGGSLPSKSMDGVCLLYLAWGVWACSVFFVLLSMYLNINALRKTVDQIDDETIDKEHQGGRWDKIDAIVNPLSGALFLLGAVLMIAFVIGNAYAPDNPEAGRDVQATHEEGTP